MKELEMINDFTTFLIQKGFPQDRILVDWKNPRNNYVYDMIVVGSDYTTPIAIFEFKIFSDPSLKHKNTQGIEHSIQFLKKNYMPSIPVYLVYNGNDKQFIIINISREITENIELDELKNKINENISDELPTYQLLNNRLLPAKIVEAQEKRQRKIDTSAIIFWIIMPLCIVAIIVLDGFGLYVLNTERIIILIILIVVLLIPFISEISLKDISLKIRDKFKKENKDNSKKNDK